MFSLFTNWLAGLSTSTSQLLYFFNKGCLALKRVCSGRYKFFLSVVTCWWNALPVQNTPEDPALQRTPPLLTLPTTGRAKSRSNSPSRTFT